jgi:Bacterial protein of unknown function (DUF839)
MSQNPLAHRAALCGLLALAGGVQAQTIGPSTATEPYSLPVAPGVKTVSILSVGDSVGGYKMVGIPDGMGWLHNNNATFDLFVNHELNNASGIVRSHGSIGAFVSRWNIQANLAVLAGRDHNTSANDVFTGGAGGAWVQGTTIFNRFCSADLPEPSAFQHNGLGTNARIYMNGEESGNEGRAFAHVVTGPGINTTYELPYLGKFSWENSVACPKAQEKTIVVGLDDSSPGQVYVYVGKKLNAGNDVERAGLNNGKLFGVRVPGLPLEGRAAPAAGPFTMVDFGNVSGKTGAQLQADSVAAGVTEFLRPEDGHWDPRPGFENDFYFVTTDRFDKPPSNPAQDGRSRLYRLRFTDITKPELGGTVTALLNGTEGQQMMDNMCIDSLGRAIIQEDPGNQPYLARQWIYNLNTSVLAPLTESNPKFFQVGAPGFLTQDEEHSGVVEAFSILGPGWYLTNTQAHYGIPGELVEGGQLQALFIPVDFGQPTCYADCDGDGALTIDDFICFQTLFAVGC